MTLLPDLSTLAWAALVVAGLLDAGLAVHGPEGTLLAGPPVPAGLAWDAAVGESVASGRSVSADGLLVAAAMAGSEHLATLVLHPRQPEPDEAERRTLERGALVTAKSRAFSSATAACAANEVSSDTSSGGNGRTLR